MKSLFLILIIATTSISVKAQSCAEIMDYVKSVGYRTTFIRYNSEAISTLTFYQITAVYQTFYYAIDCFKQKYSYSCTEHIYQVGSNTKFNYMFNEQSGQKSLLFNL